MFILFVMLNAWIPTAHAENTPSKYRQECALTSQEFAKKLPTAPVDVWCANDKRKDFGEMDHDVVHAIVVAAFYEKRLDRRQAAMNLLEKYACDGQEECKTFLYLLDWGIKSGHPKKSLAERSQALREKVAKRLETL